MTRYIIIRLVLCKKYDDWFYDWLQSLLKRFYDGLMAIGKLFRDYIDYTTIRPQWLEIDDQLHEFNNYFDESMACNMTDEGSQVINNIQIDEII